MAETTTRKEILIQSATKLFGTHGYPKTTTAMIALDAKVSEALIFKHFHSKEGLLKAVLKSGFTTVILGNKGMLDERNPSALIQKVLELPIQLVSRQPEFWRMQARMSNNIAAQEAQKNFMQPIHKILVSAFAELGYTEPVHETNLLLMVVDSLWKNMVRAEPLDSKGMIKFLQKKYKLQSPQ
jgi:AcrR family transcriptional regulator